MKSTLASSADNRMIMLIRHAEKPLHPSGSPHGVDQEGQQDPHSLTVTGWIRAGALIELFAPSTGGISHAKEEDTPEADLERAIDAFVRLALRVAAGGLPGNQPVA